MVALCGYCDARGAKVMQVVLSVKTITGVEPCVGSEWDAGYLPAASAHRSIAVTVRRDGTGSWAIKACSRKGTETIDCVTIAVLPCETCAKALALCLIGGRDYAACCEHGQSAITESALFDATLELLKCALGLSTAWASLEEGAHHRVLWVARELLDGQKAWGKVMAVWDAERAERPNLSLSAAVRSWFTTLTLG